MFVADNLFPMKDPVAWMSVEFTDAEVAEAKAALLAAASPATAPHHAAVAQDAVAARHAAVPAAAQAEAPPLERAEVPKPASSAAAAPPGAGAGEARGEYVIFRF